MAALRLQFRLRSLFLFMTLACLGAYAANRIVGFYHQSRFHHGQVERRLSESQGRLLAGRRCPPAHWRDARHHLALAMAYDHAFYHPWLSLADSQAEIGETQTSAR